MNRRDLEGCNRTMEGGFEERGVKAVTADDEFHVSHAHGGDAASAGLGDVARVLVVNLRGREGTPYTTTNTSRTLHNALTLRTPGAPLPVSDWAHPPLWPATGSARLHEKQGQ